MIMRDLLIEQPLGSVLFKSRMFDSYTFWATLGHVESKMRDDVDRQALVVYAVYKSKMTRYTMQVYSKTRLRT